MVHHPILAGKLALVTGAASGIGRSIAVAYGKAGARVVLTDRVEGACDSAVEEIAASGGTAWGFKLDVTDSDASVALAARVQQDMGDLDVLVNSAGVIIRETVDSPRAHDNIRRTMDVNLFGTFNTIHAWLPALRRSRGCIINVASGSAFVASPGALGYSASKGAVKMLTQAMAADLGKDGIRVNALAPGVIATPMTEYTQNDPERMTRFLARIPAARLGTPDELAGPAIFLASDMATYVNGVTLPVDGGKLAM
ncbi:MAG: glucose 1-dehydrogenase [Bdellovibrionales bacterium]|nr:glucose 1-dehydrogenase [Ramlibacter sp.]